MLRCRRQLAALRSCQITSTAALALALCWTMLSGIAVAQLAEKSLPVESLKMLGQSLTGAGSSAGAIALNPLYQIGGPRSVQFGLRLSFWVESQVTSRSKEASRVYDERD